MIDFYAIRQEFPALQRKINGRPVTYLDSAATSLKPKIVIDAVEEYYKTNSSNVHRSPHTLSHEATEKYIYAHEKVAEFIGAKSWREIIFTKNATEASNLVAYSLGLHLVQEKDRIITTIMEHHSNIVPWQFIAKYKKAELVFVDINDDGTLKEEQIFDLINERTKIITISGASNVTGYCPNLEKIIKEVKRINPEIIVIVDGAQLVPHKRVNVEKLGCDFLFASGYKMLGPSGTGFLWGKEELLEKIPPFMYGGDMISRVTIEGAEWNELPMKFEAGTPNISGGIGLGKAVEFLEKLIDHCEEHERKLFKLAFEELSKIPKVKLYVRPDGKEDRFIGVISFNVEGVHPHDIADFLDKYAIEVRAGHHCAQPLMQRLNMENSIRVSFYIYNTEEEVLFFIDVLKEAITFLT
ncbi:putative cysteine desulfurase [bacterium HR19]|nr:putative cysteine desulfurase [bacterium HR19]